MSEQRNQADAIGFRDEITNYITQYGSSLSLTTRDPSEGSYGGYEPGSDNEDSAVNTLAIPSNFLTTKTTMKFGKLEEGEIFVVIRYNDSVDKDSKVTWRDDNYTVQDIQETYMQDVVIAKRVKLSRRLD